MKVSYLGQLVNFLFISMQPAIAKLNGKRQSVSFSSLQRIKSNVY